MEAERCPCCGRPLDPRRALDVKQAKEVRVLWRRGWSKQALAAAYRVSVRTVERYLRRSL